MDAVGFEPTIIGTYACGLEYLTHISMNYTEPDQRTPNYSYSCELLTLIYGLDNN